MIGSFTYDQDAPSSHLKLELHWTDGKPTAKIIAPADVVERFAETLGLRLNDEPMRLSMALGYSIIVAAVADTPLSLTGDRTVWPSHWGDLIARCVAESRSH